MAPMFLVSIILTFIFNPALANSNLETYIVHLSLPEDRFFEQSESLESWYHSFLPDRDPSRIVHMYRHVINGFAAKLTPRELEEIEKKDGFLYARPEKKYTLHTTRTPTFLGLNQNNGPWTSPASFGKGVIIGVLDTGITPSHPSFDDKGVPPPPARWKGKCEFNKKACNNKLIGARDFLDDGAPFDRDGHGTHTASTAAGNFVPGANLFQGEDNIVVDDKQNQSIQLVKRAGGAALILMNDENLGYTTLIYPEMQIPTLSVSNFAGEKIKAYIKSTSNPVAGFTFKGTIIGDKNAPAVAFFSSRGPNLASPGILKPDIIGPGINIIAAWKESIGHGNPGFYIDSGTSMSCPHLSIVAALIKSAHPDLSPAMIKSAIMTTATQINPNQGRIIDQRNLPADIFAIGAGHVNPSLAMNPGLVYDITSRDYISYLCSLYDEKQVAIIVREKIDCHGSEYQGLPETELNYPSFAVKLGNTSLTYSRIVTNVGNAKSTYNVQIENVSGVNMVVEPTVLAFTELNQKMSYKVNFSRQDFNKNGSDYVQGSIAWVSANHKVRIPVSVKMV
ncbi:hypothetical protein DH2020_005380 [Rehmannia glutinosa]|uniref:Uncharacterized protein n=1 Tax=Rehmannia glutinosa TaxID=99300 RepID=A0ABR0XFX7_REHGL